LFLFCFFFLQFFFIHLDIRMVFLFWLLSFLGFVLSSDFAAAGGCSGDLGVVLNFFRSRWMGLGALFFCFCIRLEHHNFFYPIRFFAWHNGLVVTHWFFLDGGLMH
jgi:hypothetical protein